MKNSVSHIQQIFDLQKNNTASLSVSDRIEYLKILKEGILIFEDEIRNALRSDLRKHPLEASLAEIYPVISEINLFIRNLRKWSRPEAVKNNLVFAGSEAWIKKEPWGQCLIISPWNYPVQLPLLHLIASIAAGNRTIIKPSELTPASSYIISELVSGCFPEEWVAVIQGGVETSTELLNLPFQHIHFTGSPQVGKIVMAAAARHLASCTLELGGKSPFIIDNKTDLTRPVKKLILGKCFNLGQTCIAPDYALIPESRKIEFIETLSDQLDETFGDDVAGHPDLARIINRKNFDRIKALYDEAVSAGARVHHGGEFREEDLFISPTVLSDIPPHCAILHEEIFGPLIPVVTFTRVAEAKAFINSRPKPLSMYLFSNDRRWSDYFARHTSSGALLINDVLIHIMHPNLPFGGANNSGIGYSTGYYGYTDFSHLKPVLKTSSVFSPTDMMHYPFSPLLKIAWPLMLKMNI